MKKKKGHPKGRKRIIAAVVVGVLLGTLLIGFFSMVYNPFGGDIDDLRTLIPRDATWMVEVRDFPTFIKGLENRNFYTRLDQHRGFQRFLNLPEVRGAEAVQGIRQAFRFITEQSSSLELPFDLELLGDVTGNQVVIGGFAPPEPGADAPFVCALKPDSWLALAAVNVLSSETLYGWFLEGQVQDATFEHDEDLVIGTFDVDGKSMQVAIGRVENAILVGTAIEEVRKILRADARGELPLIVPSRMEPDWVWDGDPATSVKAVVERTLFDEHVAPYDNLLVPALGEDWAPIVDQFLPRLDGPDVYIEGDVDELASLRVAVGSSERRPRDLVSSMNPIDSFEVSNRLDKIGAMLPYYTWGWIELNTGFSEVMRTMLRHMDPDTHQTLLDTVKDFLPRFRSATDVQEALLRELRSLAQGPVSLVLFKKPRESASDDTMPGWIMAVRLRDRDQVMSFIDEIDKAGGQDYRRFDRFDDPPHMIRFWNNDKRWLDDKEASEPGLAITDDYLLLTNWFPVFQDCLEVLAEKQTPFANRHLLRSVLQEADEGTRSFMFLDGEQLVAWVESIKEGWIKEKVEITPIEMVAARNRIARDAADRGIPVESRERWIDGEYNRWKIQRQRSANRSVLERQYETWLGYFREGFSYLFSSLGLEAGETRIELRLAAYD